MAPTCGSAVGVLDRPTHDWRDVHLDGQWLTVPRQVLLDLSATAPARTADRCARLVADRYGVGALVAINGHVATAGPAPEGGWQLDALPADARPAALAAGACPAALAPDACPAALATGAGPETASGWPAVPAPSAGGQPETAAG